MTRKPIGLSVPHRKIGCVQHDCEKCMRGWVGLTTDEMKEIADRYYLKPPNIPVAFRAIEAKLKEKNT